MGFKNLQEKLEKHCLLFVFKKKSEEFKIVFEKFEYVFNKLSGEFAFELNWGSKVFKKLFRFNSPC